ncbi:uncharacterized protein (TIGR03083 family) [Isoptericola jiangsuensis]|uniref:Uncharacterized protein (TIGR03083 family) n=1 Tax=Isoptericola jiangsuensis TaxID=548579 RepID=A0A2A9EWR9_9MICO|nr:maleylpyruvate isomerase family mycothiol-dependent enzyme [Isoptericola jiangsuensis]PFG42730.1 uncharacterized protein (TIGR03083 family) [Isoptericola jiangsuensis]
MPNDAGIWETVHAERHRLVRDLTGLSEDRWSVPALVPGWSVHDVLAHLVDSAVTTRRAFWSQMVAARFDFDRVNERGVARHRAADPRATLEAFRAVADRTDTPPGPRATRLVEAYVHGEDIRRPLGIRATYPVEPVMTALDYMIRTGAGFGGGRERVAGLRLEPADADGARGEGSPVRGPALALLLAASGRRAGLADLTGSGVALLDERL